MKKHFGLLLFILGFFLAGMVQSCQHDPVFVMEDTMPIDTTSNPVDTMVTNPPDTTAQGVPCDPDVVYFEQQILPIFQSTCNFSGCHDDVGAQEGVKLTSFENVIATADIQPFDLEESELYKRITEMDPEERMPPVPDQPLTNDQINLIAKWILQGAENLTCDPDPNDCNTENVSFSATVQPILQNHCVGCHSGNNPGGGLDFTTHANIASVANSGRLYGAIAHLAGFEPMPQGLDQLPACDIDQIKAWIDAGALNN